MNGITFLGMALLPTFLVVLGALAFRLFTVQVEDEETILVTRFGKLSKTIARAGLHWLPVRWLPWVRLYHVSRARDYREFVNVHVNDAQGTSVMVDLWIELRVCDPVKATFAISDWDRALRNLVSHAVTSVLGNREFDEMLRCRMELGSLLQAEVGPDCERWGIRIEQAYLKSVGLRPEVEREILHRVSARLERAKADIEERGRIAVARLEADTAVRVSELVAKAKGQYPQAVGRAYKTMEAWPKARAAYDELYALTQLRPHRTVAFLGFGSELRHVDALMAPIPEGLRPSDPSRVS